MAGTIEIKRKIKSIKSTKQITRAMELVSASKMKKAVASVTSMRPYAVNALVVLTHLAEKSSENNSHPLFEKRPMKNCLIVLMASDGGLCGGFNATMFRKVTLFEKEFKEQNPNCNLMYIAVGKKAEDFLARSKKNLIATYNGITNNPRLNDILALNKLIFDYYKKGDADAVYLAYQHFFSPILQKPTMHQLLPFSRENMIEMGRSLNLFKHLDIDLEQAKDTEYKLEPSPRFILDNLLPGLIELQIFHAVLESTASEHSARMVAMRNATDNANEIIDSLTLIFNQKRQANITREIAEISAGKVALGL
ncbi:MAG: ATP synthase F1 subunit gamma, F-type H+-transporting ATPase subunit gamma [Candidatus Peregrinibacteria bacterium GW2011_GWC2_39_14]|nr:MAG: ATP synthase gamma chain [Candidatus Peregrinibacteria bacterium GW2011_GWA2_38_36]KKR04977.1 MAG: ATP synthase F1 subunit gamma, F-type H+-transporting ATPase subunit gamma [Candidatus Peregrinibacteria bacterium GW2011_GWC2_39_14]